MISLAFAALLHGPAGSPSTPPAPATEATAPRRGSDRMYMYIDEDGVPVVTAERRDPRAVRYRPGDFERIAMRQKGVPHAGNYASLGGLASSAPYEDAIARAAQRYHVPVHLVKAVIAVESGFHPEAVSRAGARGLMQLMPETAQDLGVDDPHDPDSCIDGGTKYLGFLLKHFDDTALAVAAYNAGPGRVERAGRVVPNIAETRSYVQRVTAMADAYADDTFAGGAR